jgi:crotonobetainyl-CoA:carnitine CoA-transferase CaiB-like acyl-CoA transferase
MDTRTAPPSTAPLAGILVLDLTRSYASPYCSLLLAELGAQVIKLPSLEPDSEGVTRIAAALTRHSRALQAGASGEDGIQHGSTDGDGFEALLARADVLLENRPGLMAQLGHDWADIHRLYPRLILANIPEFAQAKTLRWPSGANGGVDTASARKGSGHTEGGSPAQAGTSVEDLATGMSSALAIQAALISQVRTGLGSHVDSTVLSRQVTLLAAALGSQSRVSDRHGPEAANPVRSGVPHSSTRSPSLW